MLSIASCSLLSAAGYGQVPTEPGAPVFTTKAVNLVGLPGLKGGNSGQLHITGNGLEFTSKRAVSMIPFSAIRAFAVEPSTRGVLRGSAGFAASLTPQGMGQIYSVVRLGTQELSLVFVDEEGAVHAAVMMLPRKTGDDVLRAFESKGFRPDAQLRSSRALHPLSIDRAAMRKSITGSATGSSLMVLFPSSGSAVMPAAYLAEVYENAIAQIGKDGKVQTVLRDGDVRATTATPTLTIRLDHVRKGSAALRGGIPVIGMFAGKTQIKATVQYSDASGAMLLNRQISGAQMMPGENSGASKALARRLTSTLSKSANPPGPEIGAVETPTKNEEAYTVKPRIS